MFASESTTARHRRGFTLVELLLSVAIIAILISLVLYALQSIRKSASRTESLNALRQMMMGYQRYSDENSGALLPGYINQTDMNAGNAFAGLRVRLEDTKYQLSSADSSSYVWRLAPYLDNAWQTYMVDYRNADSLSRMMAEYGTGDASGIYGPTNAQATTLEIATRPSFGLNSVYLGGDSRHAGDGTTNPDAPWYAPNAPGAPLPPRYAAMRQAEVKNPASIIVFAGTRVANSGTLRTSKSVNFDLGYCVLTPPFAQFNRDTQTAANQQWEIADGQFNLMGGDGAANTGLPVDRLGSSRITGGAATYQFSGAQRVPLVHLDGSVASEQLSDIGPSNNNPTTQMKRWSPFAVGNN